MPACAALDQAGLLSLHINETEISVSLEGLTRALVRDFLAQHLKIQGPDKNIPIQSFRTEAARLRLTLPRQPRAQEQLCVLLRQTELLRLRCLGGDDYELISHSGARLSVMELRILGQYAHPDIPYRRPAFLSQDNSRLMTDLHTHLSAQITSEDLLEIAAQQDIAYPHELLELIGIDHTAYTRTTTPSRHFTPALSDGLACEQGSGEVPAAPVAELLRDPKAALRLREAMHIAPDRVISFDQLEREIYRMRNPLSKHPGMIGATIERIARQYQQQGIIYAELAVTAALEPDWLSAALPALAQAHTRYGVSLRLLAAIPRSLPPAATLRQLEMVKFIAAHPLIAGVDFLGFEANKTRNLAWALRHIARFASRLRQQGTMLPDGQYFRDDFTLRVHAGENGKNPDNVTDVLSIAQAYDIRVRVGHAAYGELSESLSLARQLAADERLIIEFNPDSNLAMNNIDVAEQLPLRAWAEAKIPFVLASDGAGIYRTDAQQLLCAGAFAGMDETALALLRRTEQRHIAYQQELFARKCNAFAARYASEAAFIDAFAARISTYDAADAMTRLAHKTPLLIAGASGTSWARIPLPVQQEITTAIAALVTALDPGRCYFVLGRVKHEGIGRILDEALDAHYAAHAHATQFDVVAMLSQHQNMPSLAGHINHIMPLGGELMRVPTLMPQLTHQHGGGALYIGGSAFTRDFILRSIEIGLPFAVMACAEGASAEKARILPPELHFSDTASMLAQARRLLPAHCFR